MSYGWLNAPPEYKVWYAICLGEECGWDDEECHESIEACAHQCPVCGADTEIHEDWDNR